MARNIFQKTIDIIRGKNPDVNAKLNLKSIGSRIIHKGGGGSDLIYTHLTSNTPQLICRFGTVELETVRQFLKNGFIDEKQKRWMCDTAGFFPSDDYLMIKFACEQILTAMKIDILACRIEKFEVEFVNKYLKQNLDLMDTLAITHPMLCEKPWTRYLEGKKVLVISPFVKTITQQFEKRKLLFKNHMVLPDFELLTLKAVQGIGDSKKLLPYKDWFEALDDMKSQVSAIDFDVALIGAGAYGMFLGAHCKEIGRQAVHMGGATQLLFGIKGRRWDKYFENTLYNEHWTRVSKEETPEGLEKFEEGTFAYW